jgi:hypothetical protein
MYTSTKRDNPYPTSQHSNPTNKQRTEMCSKEKIPFKILSVWVLVILLMFIFSVPELNTGGKSRAAGEYVNAVVLIAMGTLAEDPIVDSSIASIRVLGGWKGDLYLITDRKECFAHVVSQHQVKIQEVPSVDSIIKIKAMKSRLFDYIPQNVTNCLYLDVDILVTRSLDLFLGDLDHQILSFVSTHQRYPDFGMFLDARGHFFGFCSGCDKWHTGIIWLRNPSAPSVATGTSEKKISTVLSSASSSLAPLSSSCVEEWRNVLLSGRYNTDQQSIDYAEEKGHCPASLAFSSRHLLFAKDYFAAFLTPARTFVHLTSVSRMDTQDPFYRYYVVPNIKSSLRPAGLNLKSYENQKSCRT